MEVISDKSKRKVDELIEDDSSNKKYCSEYNREVEYLYGFNNSNKELNVTDCVNITRTCETEKCENDLEKSENNDIADVLETLDSESDHPEICFKEAENGKLEHSNELNACEQNKVSTNLELPMVSNQTSDEVRCNIDQGVGNQLNNFDLNEDQQQNNDNTISASNDDNAIDTNVTGQSIHREKCKYGSRCYRLNAEHKAKFSHVGDDDYDTPDNRPECPYGMNCYRKNLLHKQNYKHTRNRRQAVINSIRNVALDGSDSNESIQESVDESDYENSFIDDDDIESMEEFESDFEDEI